MRTLDLLCSGLTVLAAPFGTCASDGAAGPDQSICATATVLNADPLAEGQTGYWSLLSGSAVLSNDESPICQVTELAQGDNVFQWTILGDGPPAIDQVIITVYDPAATVAFAGPDFVLCLPTDTMHLLATDPAFPAIGSWSSVGIALIDDFTDPHSFVEFPSGGSVQMIWTVFNGTCGQVSDTALVSVEECVIGVEVYPGLNSFTLLHDPATGSLIVTNAGGRWTIEVFDQSGRVIQHHGQADAEGGRVALTSLRSGAYSARMIAGDRTRVLRFVVDR